VIPWILLFLLITFYISHSLLADLAVKKALYPIIPPTHYRIVYNIISGLFCIAIVIAYWYADKPLMLQVPSWLTWVGWGIVLAGLVVNKMAVDNYDRSEFLGLSYLQQPPGDYVSLGGELRRTGLNAWVRHPIYTSILLMVWGWFLANANTAVFTVASSTTFYTFIGIFFEERKLVREFGDAYQQYQREVKMLIPFLL